MPEIREWVTVAAAAAIVGRHPSAIYRWIEQERLMPRINADGVTEVLSKAVFRAEADVKRGRPRGTPTRR